MPARSGALQQHVAREALELLLHAPGIEAQEKPPEPGAGHLALETARVLIGGAVRDFTPPVRLEELRVLGRRELERRALQVLAPGTLREPEQLRAAEVQQPPAKAGLRVEVARQLGHLLGLEIDEQPFGDDERVPGLGA